MLASAKITTVQELCSTNLDALTGTRFSGTKTIREVLSWLILQCRKPAWISEFAWRTAKDPRDLNAAPEGFKVLSGPYYKHEREMLEVALAQLGNIPACVVAEANGELNIYRTTVGWLEVEPLQEGEA